MAEEIKKLARYGQHYSVSSAGHVISNRTGKPLKMNFCNSYGEVTVRLLGKRESVAELVAETFLSRPKGDYQLRRKDGSLLNNRANNLEWILEEEKIPYRIQEQKLKARRLRGRQATYNLRKRIEVWEKTKWGSFKRIDTVLGIGNVSRKYGVPRSAISKCCKFEREKELYLRRPWEFTHNLDFTEERYNKKYKREKTYKNLWKFRELGY